MRSLRTEVNNQRRQRQASSLSVVPVTGSVSYRRRVQSLRHVIRDRAKPSVDLLIRLDFMNERP